MTELHPITPPPELVHQWHKIACKDPYNGGTFFDSKVLKSIATQAARWGADQQLKLDAEQIDKAWQKGADQELEACCEWLKSEGHEYEHEALFAARRPKPPSLKAQALEALENADGSDHPVVVTVLNADQHALIRRALESLPS